MTVIGQRGTISGFALVVTLSVRALYWILHKTLHASMAAPEISTPSDLCRSRVYDLSSAIAPSTVFLTTQNADTIGFAHVCSNEALV
jgi:hypothetical protein